MPLSTSSFRWIKSWLVALIATGVVLSGLELFWRDQGHRPSVVDDQRLWSIERSRIGRADKEIVLVGSSRMQTDISISALRKLLPDYEVINLSIEGRCGNAVLRDLGNDRCFKGIAVCEMTPECILFGDGVERSQSAYPDYYHRIFNLNDRLNRQIATWLQKRLTFMDPYLYPIEVIHDLVRNKKLRPPNYLSTFEDRSRAADYSKIDIMHHKATRLKRVEAIYHELAPKISHTL